MDLLHLYERTPLPRDSAVLRQTLAPMLDGLSRALGYRRALVALYDHDQGCLRGSIGLNVPETMAELLEVSVRADRNPLVRALLQGIPVRIDDVSGEPGLNEHDQGLLLEMGINSFVAVPLRNGMRGPSDGGAGEGHSDDILAAGVVILGKEGSITDEDVDWLTPFTNQAGASLASARDAQLLRASSEQFAIENEWLWWMINSVADPVVVTDAQNDIRYQNLGAEAIFHAKPEDSEGKKNAIRMNNFLFTAALSLSNLEHGGSGSSRELTLVDPIEGSELVFEVISHPAFHYRSNTPGMVSVLKNITDLQYATEQLTQNVQRLQAADEKIRLERDRLDLVLRNVPNPIIVIDNDNRITEMNQEARRLFQPARQELTGSRQEQVAASNNAKFISLLANLRLDAAQVTSDEVALIDPETEEPLAMRVTSTEIRDERGDVVAVVSVMQDLTRLRELELRRVQQQLFESEKLAATGRLAASIAHEINNPLESIKNSLYLLVNRIPPEDANYQFLQIASKETERVSRILREMLGFYRPAVRTGPTDVNSLIEEAEALVEKDMRRKGVRLHNGFNSALPSVMASADQLKQVVLNLLLNAQEAMPDGGAIYLSTHLAQDADSEFLVSNSVVIQIRDTGKGIADEHLPAIFEPFFSTKLEQKGTGLGLWVSSGIIQNHGGTIKVRSRIGAGTTFTIVLPIEGPASRVEG